MLSNIASVDVHVLPKVGGKLPEFVLAGVSNMICHLWNHKLSQPCLRIIQKLWLLKGVTHNVLFSSTITGNHMVPCSSYCINLLYPGNPIMKYGTHVSYRSYIDHSLVLFLFYRYEMICFDHHPKQSADTHLVYLVRSNLQS